jgi:hypothetical protein
MKQAFNLVMWHTIKNARFLVLKEQQKLKLYKNVVRLEKKPNFFKRFKRAKLYFS